MRKEVHPFLFNFSYVLYRRSCHCACILSFLLKYERKPNAWSDLLLQQQHLIELIRLRETESALEFAQTQLAEQGEESRECLTEMERTLALLAFDNPEESPFGDLLNMMQRQKVDWD